MHTVCKAIYVACQTRDGNMAYLVMKSSPSHHLCHEGKTPDTSRLQGKKSDLMACSERLALVRHDQTLMQLTWMLKYYRPFGAFECGRIYRVYEFRLGNNVRATSQLVFASRELVTKKAAPVSDLHLVSIIASTRSRR